MNRSMIFALSFSALSLIATHATAQSPAGKRQQVNSFQVDPACLATVPWFVDPAAEDMQLRGCRPLTKIAEPDAEGWIRFDTPDGAIIQVNNVVWNHRKRSISFKVRYNGGGSMTSVYTISGGPVLAGKLKAGTFKVAF